ncbi:bifunctional folylpolyglutamate synthase/dihydrofolate synthase [Vitreimonas flagellata]|uniref:bifunctional folylpolyglutamate synthase/dihydrofolate synthase n=1 Tax=Vitreimonas flagellata TaxID=2560861 RepID=UPI0010756068|nr:folylpolyglutamate synthase/dihydrofolate synthase family protein [Vitreimonas flagellata]
MRDSALEHFDALFGPEFGHGKALDLAPLRATLAALGNPQSKLPPIIHVAGTNGKGSTIAFMRAIAEAAGLRVHTYTKPHLFKLNERFVVSGAPASEEALILAAEHIAAISRDLTQFDAQVAAAFLLFSETPADLVLLETGMGGRDDSTNVVTPALSAITPIDLDHQDVLGATLTEIATHKAGIIKPNTPAIIARQPDEACDILVAHAAHVNAPLLQHGQDWDAYANAGRLVVQTETRALDLPLPALAGAHQIENAGLACAALMRWRPDLSHDAFAKGIADATWPARLQPLTRGALSAPIRAIGGEVWVDGGHNAHAGVALSYAMQDMKARRGGKNIAIVGLRKRKDATLFIAALARFADHIIAVPLADDHVSTNELAALGDKLGIDSTTAPSLAIAMQNAAQLPAPRVLICGSFVLAAEALAAENA